MEDWKLPSAKTNIIKASTLIAKWNISPLAAQQSFVIKFHFETFKVVSYLIRV
jgi:hypothetical protein